MQCDYRKHNQKRIFAAQNQIRLNIKFSNEPENGQYILHIIFAMVYTNYYNTYSRYKNNIWITLSKRWLTQLTGSQSKHWSVCDCLVVIRSSRRNKMLLFSRFLQSFHINLKSHVYNSSFKVRMWMGMGCQVIDGCSGRRSNICKSEISHVLISFTSSAVFTATKLVRLCENMIFFRTLS